MSNEPLISKLFDTMAYLRKKGNVTNDIRTDSRTEEGCLLVIMNKIQTPTIETTLLVNPTLPYPKTHSRLGIYAFLPAQSHP